MVLSTQEKNIFSPLDNLILKKYSINFNDFAKSGRFLQKVVDF